LQVHQWVVSVIHEDSVNNVEGCDIRVVIWIVCFVWEQMRGTYDGGIGEGGGCWYVVMGF
jgi:hypothetical protein